MSPQEDDFEGRDAISAALGPRETVVWCGRGSSAVTFFGRLFTATLGAGFAALGAWLTHEVVETPGADRSGLLVFFAAAFLIVGIGAFVSLIAAPKRARRTWCAVTGARALVAIDCGGLRVHAFAAEDIGPIRKEAAKNGRSHVWFSKSDDPAFARGPYAVRRRTDKRPIVPFDAGFPGVEDPVGAERALLALKASAAARPAT